MTDNMKIWDAVSKTDPRHTKQVSFGRKFTAIDAQYQIQMATEQFGPVGQGWFYTVEYSELLIPNGGPIFQFADVTLSWEGWKYGPVRGCNMLVNDKGKIDEDAPKKALTDGLTKALSHLGFNADVFLGKFDDNKYVQQRVAEEEGRNNVEGRAPDMGIVNDIASRAMAIIDSDEMSIQEAHVAVRELLKGVKNAEKEKFGELLKTEKHEYTTDTGRKTQRSYATTFRELWDYEGEAVA